MLSQTVTYAVVEKGMENKSKLWQNHDAIIRAAAVGEKAYRISRNIGESKIWQFNAK